MWSEKEHINSTINCLLFLVAINFLHLGQLLLPIICLILFIDNKYKIKVNNVFCFIVLLLFGLSFFLFSYKTGFYSTMGFCLPMAYYIGCNIKNNGDESIKKVIYLLAFGMGLHIVFNFITDIVLDWPDFISSINHYDIWTGDYVPTTTTAVNSIFIVSIFYFLLTYEKNPKYKVIGIVLFILMLLYDLALGRRTPIFMMVLCFVLSLIIDIFVLKNKKINKRLMSKIIIVLAFVIAIFVIAYFIDLFGIKERINSLGIVIKFKEYGINPERIDIFFKAIKLMPEHLWGNREIHNILGIEVHDLWMDTYDYAGIIPFVLLIVHSVYFVKSYIKLIKKDSLTKDMKLLLIVLFVAITIQLLMEPIMSGSSLFIIIVVIVEAVLENRLLNYENRE